MGSSSTKIRVAWIFPSLRKGNYWHPIFRDFSQRFETKIYTGLWTGFSPGLEHTFQVEVVGQTKSGQDYSGRFTKASPKIVTYLWQFHPHLIFASGFSVWTILALLMKPLTGWRVVILYDGSSPSIDFRNSRLRLSIRRWMVGIADGFCANSRAAQDYLRDVLQAPAQKVFNYTYLVPDVTALGQTDRVIADLAATRSSHQDSPITTFLFVGELIPRKGMRQLLQACAQLKQWGVDHYRLLAIGDGEERVELEKLVQQQDLDQIVTWMGWIPYGELGNYFESADALIFPTLEDVWGMVVLEAMAFGRPVLCSQWAGAAELIVPSENGDLFDPDRTEELATLMQRYIQHPGLLKTMGINAQKTISPHTTQAVVDHLASVADLVLN